MNSTRLMRLLGASSILLALAACSGGGSDSSTAAPPPSGTAKTTTVVASGAITGFGSVHVNGVHFLTNNTTFMVHGKPGTQSDLRVGHVIHVHGHDDGNGNSIADRIDFDDLVVGPVTSVDVATGKVVVLGQTVMVDAETSFDDNISTASLTGLTAGTIVEISGLRRADGSIQATRIEAKPAGTAFEVTATASAVDTAAHTLKLNELAVDYATASLLNFPTGQPRNGDLIEAKGTTLSTAGALIAASLELKRGDDPVVAGDRMELEGLITRFVSATDFDVAGKPVTTTSTTVYEGGTAADLALNVKVEAEGQANAAGVLVARKVQLKRSSNARIEGKVDSVDKTTGKLVVLGIDVTVNPLTRVEDKSDARIAMFSLADLAAGDFVQIRGAELPADSNDVIATRLERERDRGEVRLRGIVDTVTRPAFTILGVTIQTDASTEFGGDDEGSMTADAFFTDLTGKVISVKGTLTGGVFVADEVEFEDAD